jgi:hypothetical protein
LCAGGKGLGEGKTGQPLGRQCARGAHQHSPTGFVRGLEGLGGACTAQRVCVCVRVRPTNTVRGRAPLFLFGCFCVEKWGRVFQGRREKKREKAAGLLARATCDGGAAALLNTTQQRHNGERGGGRGLSCRQSRHSAVTLKKREDWRWQGKTTNTKAALEGKGASNVKSTATGVCASRG